MFVCENNQYMEYTPIGDGDGGRRGRRRTGRRAYGLEPIVVDGNDAEAVHAVARTAIARARAGDGPSLIEALTYRHGGHSRADPGKYRPDDEVEAWMARDPIPRLRERARRGRRRRPTTLDAIDDEAKAAVAAAEAEAREAPEPTADVLETQVWADGGSAWRSRPMALRLTLPRRARSRDAGIAPGDGARPERSCSSARTSARRAACSS